jgi:ribosomal protein S6E (S10)
MMTRVLCCACALALCGALPASGQIAIGQQIEIQRGPGMPPLPAREGQPTKTGTSRIRGRVVAADTGQPIRRALVRVTSGEVRENRSTVTDANGVYEFRDLPAASYTLNASKGTFVSLGYGQTRPFETGRPLRVGENQVVERVDFRLPRGGVIAGRVVDELGEPVPDVQVMTMRNQFVQGRRQPAPWGRPSMTNDIGEFRLFGLPPGEYYLSATARDLSAMMATSEDRTGYAPTYYPGTPNAAEAQLVSVSVGETAGGLTVQLVQTRTSRITGVALDAEGKPMTSGAVMVMQTFRGGDMMMSFMGGGGGQIKPDGSFTVSGVTPGQYQLRATGFGGPGPLGGIGFSVATVTVTGGEDITGVVLAPEHPATARGRIIVNPPDTSGRLQLTSIRLMASPADGTMAFPGAGVMAGMQPSVREDSTFELQVSPGQMNLRMMPTTPGWSVKAVRHGGTDVTDSGIEFASGAVVDDIELEITNVIQEVSGKVTDARGQEVRDYAVLIFPQDRSRWELIRYNALARPNQDGRYSVRTLPPGTYVAAATDYIDPSERSNPELMERLRVGGITFEIREGETKVVDLRLP